MHGRAGKAGCGTPPERHQCSKGSGWQRRGRRGWHMQDAGLPHAPHRGPPTCVLKAASTAVQRLTFHTCTHVIVEARGERQCSIEGAAGRRMQAVWHAAAKAAAVAGQAAARLERRHPVPVDVAEQAVGGGARGQQAAQHCRSAWRGAGGSSGRRARVRMSCEPSPATSPTAVPTAAPTRPGWQHQATQQPSASTPGSARSHQVRPGGSDPPAPPSNSSRSPEPSGSTRRRSRAKSWWPGLSEQ